MRDAERLQAFVRHQMSDEFIESYLPDLVKPYLEDDTIYSAIGDYVASVNEAYENCVDEAQKTQLFNDLTNVAFRRYTKEQMQAKCKDSLITIGDLQSRDLANTFDTITDEMATKENSSRNHHHLAYVGDPGVGKSTIAIQLTQELLQASYGYDSNGPLENEYKKNEVIATHIFEHGANFNYGLISCDSKSLTPSSLQKQAKAIFGRAKGDQIVTIIHLEECDKLKSQFGKQGKLKASGEKFFETFQSLVENSFDGAKWIDEDDAKPHIIVFVWTGNFTWDRNLDLTKAADLDTARDHVHRQMAEILPRKLVDGGTRSPQARNITLVRCV